MSRHRKIKSMNYHEDYDDVFGDYDDDFDDLDEEGEENFEAKYLNSGIDLDTRPGPSIGGTALEKKRQKIIDEITSRETRVLIPDSKSTMNSPCTPKHGDVYLSNDAPDGLVIVDRPGNQFRIDKLSAELTYDLNRLAIRHLDKQQWQLPLLEMDPKFRDKTYFKHFTESYVISLASKLGHFLADERVILDPMKYHRLQELDKYGKYSRIFDYMTDYYQSLGISYFTFATPSPDEELLIGCRMGTKGQYLRISS